MEQRARGARQSLGRSVGKHQCHPHRTADPPPAGLANWGATAFFEWVKERVHLFRGAVIGTLLRRRPELYRYRHADRARVRHHQLLLIKDQQLTNDPDPVREYYRLDICSNARSAPAKLTTASTASRSAAKR